MRNNLKTKIVIVCTLGITSAVIANEDVAKAYQFRMNGKLDQARTTLEERIETAPNDALALFELSRTELHMGLGDPRQLSERLKGSREFIDRAVAIDSQAVPFRTFAGHVAFFQAYHAKQNGSPKVKEHFSAASDSFQTAVRLKPNYPQVMLYLVELHTKFPESAGANRKIAKTYADKLNQTNEVYAAKVKSILAADSCGVDFWESLAKNKANNAEILEELSKAYLVDGQIDQAEKHIEKAIHVDTKKASLYLDLSIYHTFEALRARNHDKPIFEKHVLAGEKAITRFLQSKPIQPMQAYALGVQSKYKSAMGDMAQARKLIEQAKSIDPYFSKATAAPLPDLFIPPTSVSKNHRYLMRPF